MPKREGTRRGDSARPRRPSVLAVAVGRAGSCARLREHTAMRSVSFLSLLVQTTAQQVTLASAGNACPVSHPDRLTSVAACMAGMHAAGVNTDTYEGAESPPASDWPAGCYQCPANDPQCTGSWFNAHATGSANGGARPSGRRFGLLRLRGAQSTAPSLVAGSAATGDASASRCSRGVLCLS